MDDERVHDSDDNVVMMAQAVEDQSLWTPRQMLEKMLKDGYVDQFNKATIVLRNDEEDVLASSRAGWDSMLEELGALHYTVHILMRNNV